MPSRPCREFTSCRCPANPVSRSSRRASGPGTAVRVDPGQRSCPGFSGMCFGLTSSLGTDYVWSSVQDAQNARGSAGHGLPGCGNEGASTRPNRPERWVPGSPVGCPISGNRDQQARGRGRTGEDEGTRACLHRGAGFTCSEGQVPDPDQRGTAVVLVARTKRCSNRCRRECVPRERDAQGSIRDLPSPTSAALLRSVSGPRAPAAQGTAPSSPPTKRSRARAAAAALPAAAWICIACRASPVPGIPRCAGVARER